MPGVSLTDDERNLLRRWQHGQYPYPTLRAIHISSSGNSTDAGLRGIRNLDIEFRYPITAIAGPNGSGKSTILALSVLAFHSILGYAPFNALRKPDSEGTSYYTFRDFFYRGPVDPDVTGVSIQWDYRGKRSRGSEIEDWKLSIKKGKKKWMNYDKRPKRPVDYFGLSRCIPAFEVRTLKNLFKARIDTDPTSLLTDDMLQRFCDILGSNYSSTLLHKKSRYHLRSCETVSGHTYSSFNMGTGEDAVLQILWMLDKAYKGSLIAIEEIEVGIHQNALKKLCKHFVEIARRKSLQIIISTHSDVVFDALPRISRVYIEKLGEDHRVIYEPTARYAMARLSNVQKPEVEIYCEDDAAEEFLKAYLPAELRKRIRITSIGSHSEIPKALIWHRKLNKAEKCLAVFDGDVEDKYLQRYLDELKEYYDENFVKDAIYKLPGNTSPEKYVINILRTDEAITKLSGMWRAENGEVRSRLEEACAIYDCHESVNFLAMSFALNREQTWRDLVRVSSEIDREGRESIVGWIERALAIKGPIS